MKRKQDRFDVVATVKGMARARLGSPRPTSVDDDRLVCRYCRREPCMCDELYDAWRDRELEKELEPSDEFERRTRGQSLLECVLIWTAVLALAFSFSNPIVRHITRHMKQTAECVR